MTTALIQILSPATKPPKSSCRNVKITKKMLRKYHQNQNSVPWLLWFYSIYSIKFAFNRATRINFFSQWDRYVYAIKKTRTSW